MNEKVIKTICENLPRGYELLYVTVSGSKLYGTDNENSDTDVKFIFKPSLEDCVLGVASKNINLNTSDDKTSNSKNDIDIQGWSIQFFLNLLKQGDTNAIDILYSITHDDCVLYKAGRMDVIFDNPTLYFDKSNMRGLLGYIVSQSDRFGLRGSRYNKLSNVYEISKILISKLTQNRGLASYIEYKLEAIYQGILDSCEDSVFCKFEVCQDGRKAIRIGGKVHLLDISVNEFMRRIESDLSRYGERTKKALDGSDWKSLSHAYRGILQINELLDTGKIIFPLKEALLLKDLKEGKIDMETVNSFISDGLQMVKNKLDNCNHIRVQSSLIDRTILNLYGV
jgi:hypothetical protein